MSSKNSSAPAAPDPAATAAAQGSANKETAIAQARLNQVNEITPFGSSIYSPTGTQADGIDQYQRTTTLSPQQQGIVDQQMQLSGNLNTLANGQVSRVGDALATPFSYDGMPAAPQADDASRQQVIDALYGQSTSRLDPQWTKLQSALQTQLANQGINVGSDAYNSSMDDFGRQRTDAYNTALNSSIASGGAEQSRLFGLQGSARQNAIQEAAYQRAVPINDIATLLGTAPGVTMPQFSPAPQTAIAPTDVTGPTALAYQGALANAAGNRSTQNAAMGGLFGLGGAALGGAAYSGALFSDRRLKRDIKKVGTLDNGLNVYLFRYKHGGPMQLGLIAQEVEDVRPEAVGTSCGFLTVDYDKAVA